MTLALWSLVLVGLGLVGSWWGRDGPRTAGGGAVPRAAWLAGLPALAPAWLVSFVSLLGGAGTAQGAPRTAFLGASAAAILGVLASDGLFSREERRPGGEPACSCAGSSGPPRWPRRGSSR